MKSFFTTVTLILATIFANATIHNVSISNFQFSPSSFNAVVGDTVIWTLSSGTHTTTSTSVPTGAATWNQTLSTVGDNFTYVITTAGSYSYHCNIHSSMTASFIVTGSSGIQQVTDEMPVLTLPTPFTGNVVVHYDQPGVVAVYNILGEKLDQKNIQSTNEIVSFPNLPQGMYIIALLNEGRPVETRKVIKQ